MPSTARPFRWGPPFTVIIDTREQTPLSFEHIIVQRRGRPVVLDIPVRRGTLSTGDYAIEGRETAAAVERKSGPDLLACLSRQRRRFEREMERMNEINAAVVVECEMEGVRELARKRGRVSQGVVVNTIAAWTLTYPRVHWFFAAGPEEAARVTYCWLSVWFRQQQPASQGEK